MQKTLELYRKSIRSGQISPLQRWDGQTTGQIFDPADEQTPLTVMGFGACRLDTGPHRMETEDREYALVPIDGQFEIKIGPELFKGRRDGGPFATLPGKSNAYAIYAPAGANVEIAGQGELIYFNAPADGHKPPAMVKPGQRENLPRGTGVWYREVVTMFTPEDVTTILVGGETYSPPGLWSGTPLHVHDKDDPQNNQTDHEEVYYHLAKNTSGQWGPFGVQMLFDDRGLDNAYVIHNRDAFAIPGAAHPVIAGPNSDMLYVWGLAGKGSTLKMLDVPEFAYLQQVGQILEQTTADRPRKPLTRARFDRLAADAALNEHQSHVLNMYLKQLNIDIRDE
ncbi:MAG: 5-deoxy-glucuronate isomerase [Planctomycetota bacterium]|jgi:5-deoxy-glucuronate isomerase